MGAPFDPDGGGPGGPPIVIYNGPGVQAVGVAMGNLHAATMTAVASYNAFIASQLVDDAATVAGNLNTAIADMTAVVNAANNAIAVINANAAGLPGNVGPTALNTAQATLADAQNALANLNALVGVGG